MNFFVMCLIGEMQTGRVHYQNCHQMQVCVVNTKHRGDVPGLVNKVTLVEFAY